jgi:hypothetical protein
VAFRVVKNAFCVHFVPLIKFLFTLIEKYVYNEKKETVLKVKIKSRGRGKVGGEILYSGGGRGGERERGGGEGGRERLAKI